MYIFSYLLFIVLLYIDKMLALIINLALNHNISQI